MGDCARNMGVFFSLVGSPFFLCLRFLERFASGKFSRPMHLATWSSPSWFGGEPERVLHWIEYLRLTM